LLMLIETVIIHKLPQLSWEEIEPMLQIHDVRETRVYQQGKEEGIEKELQRNFEEKLRTIPKLAALKLNAGENPRWRCRAARDFQQPRRRF
jgi:predicted transposase YdaD